MKISTAAFCTVSTLGLATLGFAATAIFAHSLPILVSFVALSIFFTALSYAAISAWMTLKDREVEKDTASTYFKELIAKLGVSISSMTQILAQGVMVAAFAGVTKGITSATSSAVTDSIAAGRIMA